MLNGLKKKLGMVPATEAKETKMVDETVQADLSAVNVTAELSALQASFASQSEAFAKLSKDLEAAQAALSAVEGAKAALEAEAKNKQLAARKQRVEMAIGTEKAPTMLSATEQLDDAQFEAIVSAMAMSFETEANSQMFKETGVSAKAEAVADEESLEMKIIKAKQRNSK